MKKNINENLVSLLNTGIYLKRNAYLCYFLLSPKRLNKSSCK